MTVSANEKLVVCVFVAVEVEDHACSKCDINALCGLYCDIPCVKEKRKDGKNVVFKLAKPT